MANEEEEDCGSSLIPIMITASSAALLGYIFGRGSRKQVFQLIQTTVPREEWTATPHLRTWRSI